MYKSGERAIREKEQEKRMMARIERDAQAAQDRAEGSQSPSVSAPPRRPDSPAATTSKPSARPKPVDPYANYSTAASLGFVDHEAIFLEQQQRIKEQRQQEGFASGWETVKQPVASTSQVPPPPGKITKYELDPDKKEASPAESGLANTPQIRGTLDEHEAEEAHSFKFETKSKRMLDEDEDGLDLQSIMKKVKTREKPLNRANDDTGGLDRSKWTGAVIGEDGKRLDSASAVKKDEDTVDEPVAAAPADEVKVKAETDPEEKPSIGHGGMFKKRKAPSSANRSARQKA